jgi:uncharacterized membrane protein (GlpM family)
MLKKEKKCFYSPNAVITVFRLVFVVPARASKKNHLLKKGKEIKLQLTFHFATSLNVASSELPASLSSLTSLFVMTLIWHLFVFLDAVFFFSFRFIGKDFKLTRN